MWRVEIKNTSEVITHRAEFDTEVNADLWVVEQLAADKPWGYASPSDYTKTKADITTEFNRVTAERARARYRGFGGQVIDRVAVINQGKSLTSQQIQDLSTAFDLPIKLLLQGDINTARTVILALDLTGSVFTTAERTEVVALIDELIA